jgi:hypothetical protein
MESSYLQPNQNILDLAIQYYGHVQGLVHLCRDNDLELSAEPAAGTELNVDKTVDLSDLQKATVKPIQDAQVPEVIPEPGQNLFDLAIQQFGSVSGIVDLAKNNNMSLSAIVLPGQVLNAKGEKKNKLIVNYFKSNSRPATGNEPIVDGETPLEGIGYWAIEDDFIIQ